MPALQVVIGLLLAVAVLALAARKLGVPYPIVLVVGGLAIALLPRLPRVTLAPDIVFLVFLPPLVFAAGWFTSLRDFKANLRPIGLLSIGLVLATTAMVAVVAHALVPGMPWAVALALGAIVSPTDTVAPAAIFRRLGAPRRAAAVLEGESLVNDATGLILYRYAVIAVVTGAFSPWQAGLQFVVSSIGGIAVGLLLAWVLNEILLRLDDPVIEITISFLVPYVIYLAAQQLGLSGVLAVAAAGIYSSRRSSETFSAASRVQAYAVWEVGLFVLNGLVFVLIGLQLPLIVQGLAGRPAGQVLGYALAIAATVVLGRVLWVFPATYLPRALSNRLRAHDPYPDWRQVAVVSWAGMRGVVSLAAALSLPLTTAGGQAFPYRDLVLLLTFSVILVTLVGQGLTLGPLMRLLGVGDDGSAEAEELAARTHGIEAALARLQLLADEDWTTEYGVSYVRAYYGKRRHEVETRFGQMGHDHADGAAMHHDHDEGSDHVEDHRLRLATLNRLRIELLAVERTAVVALRDAGTIGDEVLQRVQRDIDLEELRLVQA